MSYITHKKSYTRIYKVWHDMKARCLRPTHPSFPDYGGRGIGICDRWMTPQHFIADMEQSWQPGLMLERRDNNSGYNPENCYWSTPKQQANNRRTNRVIEWRGRKLTLSQWSEVLGISRTALVDRFRRCHWATEKAFTTPYHYYPRKG